MRCTSVRAFAAAIFASMLPGCAANVAAPSSAPSVFATPLGIVRSGPKPHGWLSPEVASPQSLIYVANGNEVVIFPEVGYNPPPVGAITDGIDSAYGLYVDGRRNLYVANPAVGAGTITAYAPSSTTPYITYSDPKRPLYAVTDHTGRLYASNRDGTVSEYPPRQTTSDRTLQTAGVEADGLNLDAAGNLYVAYRAGNGNGSIEEFAPHATEGTILGMQLDQPQGLEVDSAGNILVVETGDKYVIDVFPPGSTTPSQQLKVAPGVTQIALRSSERWMYISNYQTRIVYAALYPLNSTHIKIKDSELTNEQGVAASNEEHF